MSLSNSASGYDFTIEICKSLDNLKTLRDDVVEEIDKAELYKQKLLEKLKGIEMDIDKINSTLDEKKVIYGVYDKIIKDSDNAYMTIVKSTEALYQMVKNEEKKVPSKRKYESIN